MLLLGCYTLTFADNEKTDSLLSRLESQTEDTSRIDTYLALGREFSSYDTDKAAEYLRKALKLSVRIKDHGKAASTLLYFGHVAYYNEHDYNKASDYYKKAKILFKGTGDINGAAESVNMIGLVKKNQGELHESLVIFDEAMELFKMADNKVMAAACLNNIANVHQQQGNYDRSAEYFNEVLAIGEKIDDNLTLARGYNNLGIIYYYKGDYPEAIRLHHKSLDLYEELQNIPGIASCYNNIGNIYNDMKDYPNAELYFNKALALAERSGNKYGISVCLNNLGLIYAASGDHNMALEAYERSIGIFDELGNKVQKAAVLKDMANIFREKEEYNKALDHYKQSLEVLQEEGDKRGVFICLKEIGLLYARLGKTSKALNYMNEALTYAEKTGSYDNLKIAYYNLYYVHEQAGNHIQALDYHKLYTNIKDSLFDEEKHKQLAELQTKFETEKKEQSIQLLTEKNEVQKLQIARERYIIAGISGFFILAAIITFLLIRQYRNRIRQKSIILEQKLLISQMNPHFIFNSLSAIQGFILKNDKEKADHYISMLSKLMRLILENSREEYVPLSKEIDNLKLYIELQNLLNYTNKFTYSIYIDKEINIDDMTVPPMLAQPFIENSIKHGRLSEVEDGKIDIRFKLESDSLLFEITDNGIGIEESLKIGMMGMKEHRSLAMNITQERLANLNNWNKNKTKLDIVDLRSFDEKMHGTKISFYTPYKYS